MAPTPNSSPSCNICGSCSSRSPPRRSRGCGWDCPAPARPAIVWLPPIDWPPFLETLAIAGFGASLGWHAAHSGGGSAGSPGGGRGAACRRARADRVAAVAAGDELCGARLEHRPRLHPADSAARVARPAANRSVDPRADRLLRRPRRGPQPGCSASIRSPPISPPAPAAWIRWRSSPPRARWTRPS